MSSDTDPTLDVPPPHWNVFAGVLHAMLQAQDPPLGLGHLDNRADPITRNTIHPEKVARLRRSLRLPIFPTLNPDEIDQVARAFHLSADEQLRLQSAVLATAVQAMLAGRIAAEQARVAGWQVLPTIEAALRDYRDDDEGLGAARVNDDAEDYGEAHTSTDAFTTQFGAALAAIEQGWLDLALGSSARSQRERQARAHAALHAFGSALAVLETVTGSPRSSSWCFWHEAAILGQEDANRQK